MIAGKRNRDAIVMDAPIWYHTPKLILWCVFEALDLFLAIWITREWFAGVKPSPFFLPFMLPHDVPSVAHWLCVTCTGFSELLPANADDFALLLTEYISL